MISGTIHHTVGTPTLIYAIVPTRELFDALPGQPREHLDLVTKAITVDGITIIYQYWFFDNIVASQPAEAGQQMEIAQ